MRSFAARVHSHFFFSLAMALLARIPHGTAPVLFAIAALSCKSADGPSGVNAEPPSIALQVSATSVNVWRGGPAATITLTLQRVNYTGAVALTAVPEATGVNATLSPTSLSGSTLTSVLSLTAANDAPGGSRLVKITATGAGVQSAEWNPAAVVIYPSVVLTKNGTGTGTVTSNPAGINCGGTCTAGYWVNASVTLTAVASAGSSFAGWSGACSGSTATCSPPLGIGVQGNVTATFNSTAPGFALDVTPALVSIAQGANGRESVHLTRINGFNTAVAVTVSGMPTGLTVTPTTANVTGDSIALDVGAARTLAAGNYALTVTATGTGVPQRTATFNVQVTPAAGGSNLIALSFASCDPSQAPLWVAVQNDNGPWTRVNAGANNSFTFPVTVKNGVAVVSKTGASYNTTVLYGTAAELTAVATGDACLTDAQTGTKVVNGTFSDVSLSPVFATVSIGGADTVFYSQGGPNYKMNDVPAGKRDLIGALHVFNQSNGFTGLQSLIIRRDVNYANNATVPVIAFASTESFAPIQRVATLNNVGADQGFTTESLMTINGLSAPFHSEITGSTTARYYSLPDSMLRPNDFHVIELDIAPPGNNPTSARFAVMYQHRAVVQTIDFGPALSTPTISSLGTAPYLRERAQLPSQSAYNGAAVAEFSQNGNSVGVIATANYFGGTPQSWTLDIPDLSAAGYDPTWGLRGGGGTVDWNVTGVGGNALLFLGAFPNDGDRLLGATAGASVAANVVATHRHYANRRVLF